MAKMPSASGLAGQPPQQVPNPFPASPTSAASGIVDTAPFFDALLRAQQLLIVPAVMERRSGLRCSPSQNNLGQRTGKKSLLNGLNGSWAFKQYVGAVSSQMAELLDEVERDPEQEMTHLAMADPVIPQSRKSVAILAQATTAGS